MKKINAILIVMGISGQNFASEARITTLKQKKIVLKQPQTRRSDDKILSQILERNKRIQKLLERKTKRPVIWDQRERILTGKVFRGTLLNSIYSTNLKSPVLVKAWPEQGLPPNSKFSCFAITKHKRVHTLCNKLITDSKEVAVNAQVLNMDGSAGLIGEYDDGKDDLIAGAVMSNFAQGVLSASKSTITTQIGQVEDASLRNKVLEGLIQSGETTSEILLEDMKNAEPIVKVPAGTKVLVYFQEAVNDF